MDSIIISALLTQSKSMYNNPVKLWEWDRADQKDAMRFVLQSHNSKVKKSSSDTSNNPVDSPNSDPKKLIFYENKGMSIDPLEYAHKIAIYSFI